MSDYLNFPRKVLTVSELEGCQEAVRAGDTETAVGALASLVDFRDDDLVEADRAELGDTLPRCLTCFRRPAGHLLYTVALEDGTLCAGLGDNLKEHASLRLGRFDLSVHEPVNLLISPRRLGPRFDLWMVVRQWSQPEDDARVVAYHALLWLEDERLPRLAPSIDDVQQVTDTWNPIAADLLPGWLGKIPCSFTPEQDPFDPNLDERMQALVRQDDTRGPCTVALAPGIAVCGNRLGEVWTHDGKEPLTVGAWVRAIALRAPRTGQPIQGVAAGLNRELVGFEVHGSDLREKWRQHLPDVPNGLAFGTVSDASDDWPELLVACRSYGIQRLRHVGASRLEELWRRLRSLRTPDMPVAHVDTCLYRARMCANSPGFYALV